MTRELNVLAVNDPAVQGYVELGIIEDYMAEYNQKVNFEIVDFKDYGTRYQKVLAGTEKYDIFMVAGHLWLPELLEKQLILPMEFSTVGMFQGIVAEITVNQKVYIAPSFCDGHIFVYRKSDFSKAKLASPSKLVKVEEIVDWVKQMEPTKKFPIAMKAHPSEVFLDMLPFIRSYSGEPLTEAGEVISDLSLLDQGIKNYKRLLELGDSKASEYGNEEIKKVIQNNTVSMAITWNGQMGQIFGENCLDKEDLGFANLENAWNVTWGFSIHRNTDQAGLAQHFLSYLMAFDQANKIGNYSGAPIYQKSVFKNCKEYPWYDAHAELMEQAILLPLSSETNQSMGRVVDYYFNQLNSY